MKHSMIWKMTVATAGLAAGVACGGDDPQPIKSMPTSGAEASSTQANPANSTATGANHAPVIESVTLSPSHPSATDTMRANVKVSDADGDRSTVKYTWWANGRRVGEGSSFDLSNVARGAKVEVSVVAHDGTIESPPVTASVTLGNSAPSIAAIRFEPSGAWVANQSIAALPEAADPDGDPLTFEYTWYVNGNRLFDDGPTLDGSKIKRGDEVRLVVMASDGYSNSDELRTDTIKVSNSAPAITSQPGAIGSDGVFRYQLRADDPDGDRAFMYRVVQAPPGTEMDLLEGKVIWRPQETDRGEQAFVLEVDDRMGGKTTQKFTIDVTFEDDAVPASPR